MAKRMIQVGSHAWVDPAHIIFVEGGDGGWAGTKAGNAVITLTSGARHQTDMKPSALLKLIADEPK